MIWCNKMFMTNFSILHPDRPLHLHWLRQQRSMEEPVWVAVEPLSSTSLVEVEASQKPRSPMPTLTRCQRFWTIYLYLCFQPLHAFCFWQAFAPLLTKAAAKHGGSSLSCSRAAIINTSSGVGSITEASSTSAYPYRTSKVFNYLPVFLILASFFFWQAFAPLLTKAAAKHGGSSLSCSRAAIINISSGIGSITETSSTFAYPYRTSKVLSHLFFLLTLACFLLLTGFCTSTN